MALQDRRPAMTGSGLFWRASRRLQAPCSGPPAYRGVEPLVGQCAVVGGGLVDQLPSGAGGLIGQLAVLPRRLVDQRLIIARSSVLRLPLARVVLPVDVGRQVAERAAEVQFVGVARARRRP